MIAGLKLTIYGVERRSKNREKRGKGRKKEKGEDMKESKNLSEIMGMHSVLPEPNSFAVSTPNKHAKERKQGTVCAMCAVGTHRI